jgi:hypothetical protein
MRRSWCQAISSTARQALCRASHSRMRRFTSSGRSCCTKCEQSSNTCSSRSDTYFSVPCDSQVHRVNSAPLCALCSALARKTVGRKGRGTSKHGSLDHS